MNNKKSKNFLPTPSYSPSVAQLNQINRKYGMFIHFGMNTFLDAEWSDGKTEPSKYQPTDIDALQWVKTAKDAGMKYIILVTKHHDGFCLWDSKYTDYDVSSASKKTNIVEEVAKSCKKLGIGLGLYYSLWDMNFNGDVENPDKDKAYNNYMLNQLDELMVLAKKHTNVVEFWFDGGWAKSNDRWPTQEIYNTIKSHQPDCQVGINWSIGLPGNIDYKIEYHSVLPAEYKAGYPIRYFPSDFRLGDPYMPVENDPKIYTNGNESYYMPFQTTVCISEKWFYHTLDKTFKSVETLLAFYERATAEDNILILNCPPNRDGKIRPEEIDTLQQLKKKIEVFNKSNEVIEIPLLESEKIWSGAIKEGHKMPFESGYSFSFYANNDYNQLQPLLVSNRGLYVWSEGTFTFNIEQEKVIISNSSNHVYWGRKGSSMSEARQLLVDRFFPPSASLPEIELFTNPQYNTWIELTYFHTQDKVLEYARNIINNGFPAGVIMIDESWQENYGIWKFHSGRFPDPKSMIQELHELGFKVMLWVAPFICPDRHLVVDELLKKKALLLDSENGKYNYENASKPAIVEWWNGYSACLDFTSNAAVEWFEGELEALVNEFCIDGFKFDGGDMNFYPDYALSQIKTSPNEHCRLYALIGLKYSLNEFRACWKMANLPLAQRLHDKFHTWNDLKLLIPHMLCENLSGYAFSCPDMIGGGEWTSFKDGAAIDQQLVVRSAQCHALMPMMQFSAAPWRILDKEHLEAVQKAIKIRECYTDEISHLAHTSSQTGDIIIGPMEYFNPNQGLENAKDQFMLGKNLIVAPMVENGFSRKVILPKGKWKADDGLIYTGLATIEIEVPLDRIPIFERVD